MENLAGDKNCDAKIERELRRAGIPAIRGERSSGEVSASVTGKFGSFTFRRAWYYWVVKGNVPLHVAKELYADPIGQEDVRVAGHGGCPPPGAPWIEYHDKEGRLLRPMKELKELKQQTRSESAALRNVAHEMINDPTIRFVKDPAAEGDGFITSYHIDSEVGLRLFVETIKKYKLV